MAITDKTQANSLRQNIANTGGAILQAISAKNPTLGGQLGKAVDYVGKKTNNYFPETGASERAESAGGVKLASTDPGAAAAKEIERSNQLGIPLSQTTTQKITTNQEIAGGGTNPNETAAGKSELKSERAMGHNVGDVVDFNGAKWRWDGNTWTREGGGGGDQPEAKITGEDVFNAAKGSEGSEFLNQSDLDALMGKYGDSSKDRMDQLARDIEETATANAEREYNTIKEALGVQKGEVQTLATQQKKRLGEEKKFTEEGFVEKETTETGKIEGEKESFRQETESTKEELATSWRDLSLELQRVMRARGVSESAFAGSQDAKLMLDFNKGLRQIAVKSTAAYQDFADAVIETNKYYTRERAKLEMDERQAQEDVDNWVRQNVQSIQAQENTALNRKLSDIKNAILQGNQLKVQTAQKIEDQKLGLATWMLQFQAQLKASVATAAAGKVDDAWKNIAAVRQNTDIIKTVF